jgi:hypothetical protein
MITVPVPRQISCSRQDFGHVFRVKLSCSLQYYSLFILFFIFVHSNTRINDNEREKTSLLSRNRGAAATIAGDWFHPFDYTRDNWWDLIMSSSNEICTLLWASSRGAEPHWSLCFAIEKREAGRPAIFVRRRFHHPHLLVTLTLTLTLTLAVALLFLLLSVLSIFSFARRNDHRRDVGD